MSELAILGGRPLRTRPFPRWPQASAEDIARVAAVIRSGNWGGYPFPNELAAKFASEFAAAHGAGYGCCVANGTLALVAALQAAGLRFGDEVIVPAYTWDGTAAAVLFAGGVPVFADVRPDTWCLDVECARAAITPRTRAILPVHLAMRCADLRGLLDLAFEHDLLLIEDCAHAHGGVFAGRGVGSWGDLGAFSFQSSKLMPAGEGGMVITSRLDCFEAVQSLVNCGRASQTDQFKRRLAGSNYRMTELQAALLLGQLERLPELARRRSQNAALLTRRLAEIPGVSPLAPQPGLTRDFYYNYVFRYEDLRAPRDLFAAALEQEGIPCDGRFYEAVYRSDLFHPSPAEFPQLAGWDQGAFRCPVAERAAYAESVWLPQFVLLGGEEDMEEVAAAIAKVMGRLDALARTETALAGVKSMSRAERPRVERERNY